MRKSSRVGFGASLGLAILSASFVSDYSSEQHWSYFLSYANAEIPLTTASTDGLSGSRLHGKSSILTNEMRRRALLNRVYQKLIRKSAKVDPILL